MCLLIISQSLTPSNLKLFVQTQETSPLLCQADIDRAVGVVDKNMSFSSLRIVLSDTSIRPRKPATVGAVSSHSANVVGFATERHTVAHQPVRSQSEVFNVPVEMFAVERPSESLPGDISVRGNSSIAFLRDDSFGRDSPPPGQTWEPMNRPPSVYSQTAKGLMVSVMVFWISMRQKTGGWTG